MVIAIAPPALLLATSTTDQLVRSLFDDTFNGVHHLAFFDWALLVPYFAILIVLSFYGCHRFEMIRKYLKHRRDLAPDPAERWAELPRVTVQLRSLSPRVGTSSKNCSNLSSVRGSFLPTFTSDRS